MEVLIWIIIIVVAILIIRLLRRWIKRLIFIAILLVLAFFIYGIFNPSGAGKLWYNVRTLPQRISSRISDQSFMDYENYKSTLSKDLEDVVSNSIDSINIELSDDENNSEDEDKSKKDYEPDSKNEDDINEIKDDNLGNKPAIKVFPKLTNYPDISKMINKDKSHKKDKTINDTNKVATGYTKSDLLGIIDEYIDKHLDDYTDILVTVEYEGEYNNPLKITLEAQPRPADAN